MGWATTQIAIEAKFNGWTATRIKWANKAFSEPNVPWIAVFVLEGEGQVATLGTPHQRRHAGVVSCQIFDKENQGENTIDSLADQIEARFINAGSQIVMSPTETITFDQPSLTAGQTVNGWRQKNLQIPFYRDIFS